MAKIILRGGTENGKTGNKLLPRGRIGYRGVQMLHQTSPIIKREPVSRWSVKRLLVSTILSIAFLAIVYFAIREGLALRNWEYPATEQFRFHYDINNAWSQGQGVLADARKLDPKSDHVSFSNLMKSYLARYDVVIKANANGEYQLDYTPARLLIMTIWVWHETEDARYAAESAAAQAAAQNPAGTAKPLPNARPGQTPPRRRVRVPPLPTPAKLAGPLLVVNTVFELLGMAGAFMLARAVLVRQKIRGANFIALLPAILLWFNPALLLDAHAWPQWEAWPLPFWLWAGYFAVTRRWIAAGLCLGFGSMFKGQIAATMAFFVLWPLFQGRLHSFLNVAIGILLGAMIGASPWMLLTNEARVMVVVAVVTTAILLPWVGRGWRMTLLCGVAGAALLLVGIFLGGDFGWLHVGFEYGARRWAEMNMGPTPNLAGELSGDFGWRLTDVVYTLDRPRFDVHKITMQNLLSGFYVVGLVLSAIAAARQDRRGDRTVLLAMAAPWLVMFAFLPQMHERYLVWSAVFTALAAAVSFGTTLLHFVVTCIAFVPIAMSMPGDDKFQHDYPNWGKFLDRANSNSAWMVVLLAIIFVYLALTGSTVRGGDRRRIVND